MISEFSKVARYNISIYKIQWHFCKQQNFWKRNKLIPLRVASRASLVAQMIKCLPAMRKTQVWSLGQEHPLEKEMATHSSTLAWKIPWMEVPGGLQSMGSQRVGHDWTSSLTLSFHSSIKHDKILRYTFNLGSERSLCCKPHDMDERNGRRQINGEVPHVYGLEELILLKC